ncbi:relaxase/mobilization nuclease RlxS [Novosphingobium sp. Gsoil 351]|uniref:relaxase/mobilization nuclease RlxS n=1 Tax=Novosphingobium sp. Gsoil 351 TaxID=2675225 RepID=UPI0012B4CFC9|nr:relaxase/mobilization nuclease RlxS [Novosphingobium sp. Gsoil 351]QGN54063.1 DUF3363 domain-containing protein [Novosphingobium sp. Gsoil 351]
MAGDEDFTPRIGRMRATKGRRAARYASLVLAATNLARGGVGVGAGGRAPGAKVSRGSGVGRVLANRGRLAAFRARRVIVKARIVRLACKGAAGARAHLRYLERDGTTREGERGSLYGPASDRVEARPFLERGVGDRHQFRFIVSPEDGAEYDDLKPLVRRLMERVGQDLRTPLDWVAVDHFNTGNPHSHIVVRGVDASGRDLVIARDYLTQGMRERAAELIALDLGPRDDRAIERSLRAEIGQERLTGIDRRLLADAREGGLVLAAAREPFEQSLRAGRLATLARMGLAREVGSGVWRLEDGLADTLRRMGERGDIIRTMQRTYAGRDNAPALSDRAIYDAAQARTAPLVGKVVTSGLADEHADRRYVVIEATDGRAHYVALGAGAGFEPLAEGSVVRVAPRAGGVRQVDRIVAQVAAANDGIYRTEAHLRHDPSASEEFAKAHVRRLEALRRGGAAVRNPDGSWRIGADHLSRVEAYEAAQRRSRPVVLTVLSPWPLEQLVDHEGATWLDRELTSASPVPLREAGFGAEARRAQEQRRRWLIAQGLGRDEAGPGAWPADLHARLERREVAAAGARLAGQLGLAHVEIKPGARIEGTLLRREQLASGAYAVVGRSREFALVPWRPELERHLGKQVSGIVRASGISWTMARRRSGPGFEPPSG